MKSPPLPARDAVSGDRRFRGTRAAQLVPHARLAGPMPWVIAIMIALTVIAAAGGLALSNLVSDARADLAGGITVQIVEASAAERERQTRQAARAMAQDPSVSAVRIVPPAELEALLEPWLGADIGAGGGSGAVPMPALIDARLRGSADAATLQRLRERLRSAAPAARLDAQSAWLGPVFSAINSLLWLAAALVVLLGLTSAAAVWLAARSALGGNRATIEIVHLLGGTDGQIARIFQRSVAFDAMLGGAVGLALGLAAILLLGQQFARLDSGMVAGGGLHWQDWLLLAAVPLAGIVIAVLTARLTILAALRRMS